MLPDLQTLATTIRDIARDEILPRFERVGFAIKQDGSLLTEADLATNRRISQFLKAKWPDIAFLSEEMEAQEQEQLLQQSDLLWCLDPLDGTSNFAAGFPLFGVALALIENGRVVMGLTYDPIRDEMFTAQVGKGTWLNDKRLRCRATEFSMRNAVAMVDFKRLSPRLQLALLNDKPYGSQRSLGTCALEWAWMAANRGHLYLHGGMKVWDLAAGSLLVAEAGGFSATLDGEAVFKASMAVRSAVVSPDEKLFQQWLSYLQKNQ